MAMPKSAQSSAGERIRSDRMPSFSVLLVAAGLLRAVLIAYGVYHDARQALKYTDVDYYVFFDASAFILRPLTLASGPYARHLAEQGYPIGSPYDRATYRYTPLLAVLLLPNTLLHPLFGKVLFASADLVVGYLLYTTLCRRKAMPPRQAKTYVSIVWLLNPFVANISTRGSAESILGVLVVGAVTAAEAANWRLAAVLFGTAVHFKLYPVIYAAAFLSELSNPRCLLNARQIAFGLHSLATFAGLNAVMQLLWGKPFWEHTFLYHLSRLDHRHNFSQHFYPIYLSLSTQMLAEAQTMSWLHGIYRLTKTSFIPQLGLSALVGFGLGKRASLAFVCFIQTMCFVTFNRVCTSQYFMWSLWFLPLSLPELRFSGITGWSMLGLWVAGQALWLGQGYKLEFLGEPVYLQLFWASISFFLINVALVCWLLRSCSGVLTRAP